MSKEEKERLFVCKLKKTILGTIFVIAGYMFLRYLGFVSIIAFIGLAVIIILYGTFFDK